MLYNELWSFNDLREELIDMKQRTYIYFHLAALFLCLSLVLPVPSYGGPMIEKVQKAYEGIRDIKGSFVQKSHIKDLKRTDVFQGTFMIRVPSKMRWRYSGDKKQQTDVIIKNDELLIYQKDEKQVIKGKFDKESYGQSPIALLGGFGNIEREFDSIERDGKLVLTPKNNMGSVVLVELTLSDGEFPVGALAIVDKLANRIEITFKNVVINSGIKDSKFEFSAPKGVTVFEYGQPR